MPLYFGAAACVGGPILKLLFARLELLVQPNTQNIGGQIRTVVEDEAGYSVCN